MQHILISNTWRVCAVVFGRGLSRTVGVAYHTKPIVTSKGMNRYNHHYHLLCCRFN